MPYGEKKGQYPYPLNYLPSDGGNDLTVYESNDPTVLVGSNNWYVLCLTPDEMVELQSIVAIGSPLILNDDFNRVIQKYMQLREYPNEIPEESCMDLCQLIIECIQTTPELRELLGSMQNGYQVPLDQLPIDSISNSDMISDNTDCDNDKMFGAVTGLVDLLNDLAEDFLELMQDNVNSVSRIAEFIEVIPGVGEVVPADLLTLSESFVEDLMNLYQSAYTVQVRNDFRCDLFCLFKEDCNFSIEDAITYFKAEVAGGITFDDFNDFIGVYLIGGFTGKSLVASWNVWVLGMLQFGSSALGISADDMIKLVTAMFNDPDSDWETLCDCGWNEQWLSGNGNPVTDGWVLNYGTYDATNDWELGATHANGGKYLELKYSFIADSTITNISWSSDIKSPTQRDSVIRIYDNTNALIVSETISVQTATATTKTLEWIGEQAVASGWYIVVAFNAWSNAQGATEVLKDLIVGGLDDNPFI